MKQSMARMKQSITRIKQQLGWQGITGIALLFAAWAFNVLSLAPLEQDNASMLARIEASRTHAYPRGSAHPWDDRQGELGKFFESLPREKDATDILAAIYSAADTTGVTLREGEYRLDDKDWPRVEYGMSFPVEGEYGKIRGFISRVLADQPAISLDQIDFQRDRISDATVKANIRFTLFLRPESAANQAARRK